MPFLLLPSLADTTTQIVESLPSCEDLCVPVSLSLTGATHSLLSWTKLPDIWSEQPLLSPSFQSVNVHCGIHSVTLANPVTAFLKFCVRLGSSPDSKDFLSMKF